MHVCRYLPLYVNTDVTSIKASQTNEIYLYRPYNLSSRLLSEACFTKSGLIKISTQVSHVPFWGLSNLKVGFKVGF